MSGGTTGDVPGGGGRLGNRWLLPALADLFQIITVPPFARGKAIDCLTQIAQTQRQNHKIDVEPRVVETIYRLFARFLPYHAFPGRSTAFLDQLFEEMKAQKLDPFVAVRYSLLARSSSSVSRRRSARSRDAAWCRVSARMPRRAWARSRPMPRR